MLQLSSSDSQTQTSWKMRLPIVDVLCPRKVILEDVMSEVGLKPYWDSVHQVVAEQVSAVQCLQMPAKSKKFAELVPRFLPRVPLLR